MMKMDETISRWAAIDALTNTNLKRNFDSVYDGDMNRTRRAAQRVIAQLPAVDTVPVVRCRNCKYFEVKDVWADFGKVPILVSDVPMCHKWGDGECKTSPDGFCFLGERRDEDAD